MTGLLSSAMERVGEKTLEKAKTVATAQRHEVAPQGSIRHLISEKVERLKSLMSTF